MKPIILFRADSETQNEFFVAQKYFEVTKNRNSIPADRLVIGRYSTLPYFRELEEDVRLAGSKLIDSYSKFNYIASFDYYHDIEPYTFKTWFEPHLIPNDSGPLVVKGTTNSKKGWWKDKMFAENKQVAILTAIALREDSLFQNQEIIFRKYEKLKTYELLLNNLPITDEYRFFFYKKTELCHGYYWSNAEDITHKCTQAGIDLAHKIAEIISDHCNFFVVDVAQKENGEWIVVELNHGTMSELSMCDPDELYGNLAKAIKDEYKVIFTMGEPKFIGTMSERKDIKVIPKTHEQIDAEIAHYESFQGRYLNSPTFKTRIDAECMQWEKERQEFLLGCKKHDEELWAQGIPTYMIEPHFYKPYPRPHDPRINGWKCVEFSIKTIGSDKKND